MNCLWRISHLWIIHHPMMNTEIWKGLWTCPTAQQIATGGQLLKSDITASILKYPSISLRHLLSWPLMQQAGTLHYKQEQKHRQQPLVIIIFEKTRHRARFLNCHLVLALFLSIVWTRKAPEILWMRESSVNTLLIQNNY